MMKQQQEEIWLNPFNFPSIKEQSLICKLPISSDNMCSTYWYKYFVVESLYP